MNFNPFDTCRYNYNAASNDMKLVHWLLMGGLLHSVEDLGGAQLAQSPPRCTTCNSPPINGQCTNYGIDVCRSLALRF